MVRWLSALLVLLVGCDVVWRIDAFRDGGVADADIDAPPETIMFVQGGAFGYPSTSSTTVAATLQATVHAGDVIVVFITWTTNTAAVAGVTDTAGNVFTPIGPATHFNNLSQAAYFAENVKGSVSDTITATWNQPAAASDIRIAEYSGLATMGSLDTHQPGSGTGDTLSATITTTNDHDLLVASTMVVKAAAAGPPPQMLRVYYLPTGNLIEDKTVRTAGAHMMTATEAPPDDWVFDIVAFKAL